MSCDRLTGKTALITGAASGVGRATALRFASEGATALYLWDLNEAKLRTVVEEVGALGATAVPITADVGDDAACDAAVARIVAEQGALDILVSNASAHSAAAFLEMGRDEWDRVLRIMLRSSFVLGQLAAR